MVRLNRKLIFTIIMLTTVVVSGCGHGKAVIKIDQVQPLASPSSATLMAGTAKIDITPAAGMPMGGNSTWSNYGNGVRTKLYARCIYLKPAQGRGVALVQCDLLSGSRLVHHRVAELTARASDIGAENLMLSGTHTHSAPGNFFESDFYNRFGSNAPGLDADFVEALSQKIAQIVIEAYKTSRPARAGFGSTEVWGFTRNRSLEAYRANPGVPADISAEQAVNPMLSMLRIDVRDDDGQYRPLAAFSSFSLHPNALPCGLHGNDVYQAEAFAFIEREVEWGVQERYQLKRSMVHAAVNGTHADNSAAYAPGRQSPAEAKRIGTAIGHKALALFVSLDDRLRDDIAVVSTAREVDVFAQPCIEGICLSPSPAVGNTLLPGAEDCQSPVLPWLPFIKEGSPRWFFTQGPQGHKRIVGGILQPLALPRADFPHEMFLQAIRIGDLVLLPVPFEVTATSGRNIVERCRAAMPSTTRDTFVVLSVSNGYWGYMATGEEYARQHYEGGSTLYGPHTNGFIAAQAAALYTDLTAGRPSTLPPSWQFLLRRSSFIAQTDAGASSAMPVEAPRYQAGKDLHEAYWSFTWSAPSTLALGQTLVTIEQSPDGKDWATYYDQGRKIDNEGYDIEIRCLKYPASGKPGLYETRWYNPSAGKSAWTRFAIQTPSASARIYSPPFEAATTR